MKPHFSLKDSNRIMKEFKKVNTRQISNVKNFSSSLKNCTFNTKKIFSRLIKDVILNNSPNIKKGTGRIARSKNNKTYQIKIEKAVALYGESFKLETCTDEKMQTIERMHSYDKKNLDDLRVEGKRAFKGFSTTKSNSTEKTVRFKFNTSLKDQLPYDEIFDKWSKHEDFLLWKLSHSKLGKKWSIISKIIKTKTINQCIYRYKKLNIDKDFGNEIDLFKDDKDDKMLKEYFLNNYSYFYGLEDKNTMKNDRTYLMEVDDDKRKDKKDKCLNDGSADSIINNLDNTYLNTKEVFKIYKLSKRSGDSTKMTSNEETSFNRLNDPDSNPASGNLYKKTERKRSNSLFNLKPANDDFLDEKSMAESIFNNHDTLSILIPEDSHQSGRFMTGLSDQDCYDYFPQSPNPYDNLENIKLPKDRRTFQEEMTKFFWKPQCKFNCEEDDELKDIEKTLASPEFNLLSFSEKSDRLNTIIHEIRQMNVDSLSKIDNLKRAHVEKKLIETLIDITVCEMSFPSSGSLSTESPVHDCDDEVEKLFETNT